VLATSRTGLKYVATLFLQHRQFRYRRCSISAAANVRDGSKFTGDARPALYNLGRNSAKPGAADRGRRGDYSGVSGSVFPTIAESCGVGAGASTCKGRLRDQRLRDSEFTIYPAKSSARADIAPPTPPPPPPPPHPPWVTSSSIASVPRAPGACRKTLTVRPPRAKLPPGG